MCMMMGMIQQRGNIGDVKEKGELLKRGPCLQERK